MGAVAYKLKLPPTCSIHLVIHVSQLKKALAPTEVVQLVLPDLVEKRVLERILGCLFQRLRAASGTQVQVQWSGESLASTTWEEFDELRTQFLNRPAWGGKPALKKGDVTTHVLPGRCQDELQCGKRNREPSARFPAEE